MAEIRERIEKFRKEMKEVGADYYILDDADPHGSEYVCDFYRKRTYFSGFDGSNGKLLLGLEDAYLWTDGRYFIQAELQLKDTGILLMKMGEEGVPSLSEFLADKILSGSKVMYDALTVNENVIKLYLSKAGEKIELVPDRGRNGFSSIAEEVFSESEISVKPEKICVLSEEILGNTFSERIEKLRERLLQGGHDGIVISDLSENMYLFGIRGNDIIHNPVAFSYSFISGDRAVLFVYDDALTFGLNLHSERNEFEILPYESFTEIIKDMVKDMKIAANSKQTSNLVWNILKENAKKLTDDDLDVALDMAIKNDKQIEILREVYRLDSECLKEFLKRMKTNPYKTETEARMAIDDMRLSIPECYDLSFDTISAYGANAAMMHYEDNPEKEVEILPGNMYLCDSGGQWEGGTTDVTRTIIIGEPTYEMKHDFTKVVRGMLTLANAVFMEGCTGINLDILARAPMWEEGEDYKCGTGHGIGFMLSVHEGPHAIRWKQSPEGKDTVLKPGMLVSDEPGIYKEGKYGIRMENILLVKEKCTTSDGRFLCFECLTKVPVDEDLIIREEMSEKELMWLDSYNAECL